MKPRASNTSVLRKLSAYACLLATILLYSPFAAATWAAHGMNCCDGESCPIHGHHSRPAAPAHEADCAHEGSGISNCSLRCCQVEEKAAVHSLIFVLPILQPAALGDAMVRAAESPDSFEIGRSAKPLSPPPRFNP